MERKPLIKRHMIWPMPDNSSARENQGFTHQELETLSSRFRRKCEIYRIISDRQALGQPRIRILRDLEGELGCETDREIIKEIKGEISVK